MYNFISENIDKDVKARKHYTEAGAYIGWKYIFNIPCCKRSVELVQFSSDDLVLIVNNAWVSEAVAKKVLLLLKGQLNEI